MEKRLEGSLGCYLYNSASNQSKLCPTLPQQKSSQAGDDFINSLPFNTSSSHTDLQGLIQLCVTVPTMSSHGAKSQACYCLSFPSKSKSITSYLAQPCLLTSKAAVKPCAHRNQEIFSSPVYFKIIIITKSNCEWQSCLLPETSLNSPFRSGGNTAAPWH